MDEAEYCDRIAIMDHGQIVVLDTPEALKASVGKDRVQIATDDDDGGDRRAARRASASRRRCTRAQVTFARRRAASEFVPRLFAELGVPIKSVSVSRPSLDDVFMSYTGTTIRDAEATGERPQPQLREDDGPMTTGELTATAGARRRAVARSHVPRAASRGDLRAVKIVWQRELIRFWRDRMRIVTSLLQPLLFLFVLGTGLSRLASAAPRPASTCARSCTPACSRWRCCSPRSSPPRSIVWDREFGFLREMLVAPVRRGSIVLGKCLGGATVAALPGR